MTMLKWLSSVLLSIMLVWLMVVPGTGICHARELVIAFSDDIPPFVMDNGTKGLEIDIMRAALGHKGYSFKVLQCSYKRLQIAVTEMGLDGAAAVRESRDGTFYSDNFIAFRNFAITKKKSGIRIDTLEDLKGKTIVAWQNAYRDLGVEFEALFSPNRAEPYRKLYLEVPIQKRQVELFLKGRAEVIIIDEAIFKWFKKKLESRTGQAVEVVYHSLFNTVTRFRVSFRDVSVRDDFNQGLRFIREKGIYRKILDSYFH